MAFNTSQGRAEYTATAAQTKFTFTFKIYDTSDVKVYLTPTGQTPNDTTDILIETTDYTVTINGDNGGDVDLVSGATLNDSITLVRELPTTRSIEYQANGDLTADAINADQDYQTYLILDAALSSSRAMTLQESTQGVSTEMPSPSPLSFFQWNATGTAIQNQTSFTSEGILWTASDVYLKTETYSQVEADAKFLDEALNLSDLANVTTARTNLDVYSTTEAEALMLGVNQTWQDLTVSRALATPYTNTTGKPIYIVVRLLSTTSGALLSNTIDGITINGPTGAVAGVGMQASFVIPNGSTYSTNGTNATLDSWHELR